MLITPARLFHADALATGYLQTKPLGIAHVSAFRPLKTLGTRIVSCGESAVSSRDQVSQLNFRSKTIAVAMPALCAALLHPSPCNALHIPSPSDMQISLISLLDNLSHSGTKGMMAYTLAFIFWTATVGATTPIETAAGMAFPLAQSIPLSAIGKIGGAFLQYSLAKYIFRDWARSKMRDNEWMNKIDRSFQSHPFRVALIWRFSPLPEFIKNIGPSLVPTLKTRYQIMATFVHGLPFTVLWSMMGNEAAAAARGKGASTFLKRMVAGVFWVGLFVSPTLFGCWIKGLEDGAGSDEDQ